MEVKKKNTPKNKGEKKDKNQKLPKKVQKGEEKQRAERSLTEPSSVKMRSAFLGSKC